MVAAAVIAWLGLLVHNVTDLPAQTLLNPETLWPSLVTAALLAVYAVGPGRLAGIGLFGWALMNPGPDEPGRHVERPAPSDGALRA